jgi:hypothetical protein
MNELPTPLRDYPSIWQHLAEWEVHGYTSEWVRVVIRFPREKSLLNRMHLIRKLKDLPLVEARTIAQNESFDAGEMEERTGRTLVKNAKALGLGADLIDEYKTSYLPRHINGSAMLIEDDNEARQLCKQMLDAGCKLVEATGC